MISQQEREALVQEWLDRTSLPREFAEEFVAIGLGEIEGDIEWERPLTPEERRRIFPVSTLEDALKRMKDRAKQLEQTKAGV